MEVQTIIQAISTVGFPIVMCIALLYYMNENEKRFRDELDKLSSAIHNNTTVMTKLLERMDEK